MCLVHPLDRLPGESAEDWADRLVVDLARQHRCGSRPRVAAYLDKVPGLSAAGDVVLDLLVAEWDLRRSAGEVFTLQEYRRGFPAWAEDVRLLWEVERPGEEPWPEWYSGTTALPAEFAGHRLERELPGGGQARVFVASPLAGGDEVVLKAPRLEAGHTAEAADRRRVQRERFLREARRMEQLRQTRLCPALAVGQSQGLPYFTMPYYPAGTVADELARGPVAAERAARIVADAARAVQQAHDRGVLHRDLKPSNLLLDGEGVVVGDLGMSLDLDRDERLTSTGHILGTPCYLSPEQAAGGVLGPASDQFSLGVVLYELCAGERPFQGANMDLVQAILRCDPPPLAQRRPDVPQALAAICRRAMARKPEDRYPSMNALADDLERFLAGTWAPEHPLQHPDPARGSQGRRWGRRACLLAAVGGLLALLGWGLLSPLPRSEPPPGRRVASNRPPIGLRRLLQQLRDDMASLSFEQRRHARYLSLLAVHDNPYIRDSDYEDYRPALERLLNRLSRKTREVSLRPVGREGALLRLDLRELDWDPDGEWLRLVRADPYRVRYDGAGTADNGVKRRFVEVFHLAAMHPEFDSPCVRADWLLAAGSRAPLFDVLQTGQEQPRNVPPFDLDGDGPLPRLVRLYDAERVDARVAAAELGLGADEELVRRCAAVNLTVVGAVSRADWEKREHAEWTRSLKLGVSRRAGQSR